MKICVATGTRAEYGLLKPLIDRIKAESGWQLQLLVTGAHLSPEFGLTFHQIEEDGLHIDVKIEMLLSSDTPSGTVKSMGVAMIGMADAFKELQPDLLIVLGDRYEMLAVVSAALIFKIPVAHLHGGEITEGAYDDAIRHAITKMSNLHFTSTEQYRRRVIQLGENPKYVYNVGAIGLDSIISLPLLSKEEVEKRLHFTGKQYNYLVTFHPVTLDPEGSEWQLQNLLDAVDEQKESFFIFTKANADTGGRRVNQLIQSYAQSHKDKVILFSSLGSLLYLSVMKFADAVIGNSSSGIIEAPCLKTPTINIGNRQKGRIMAESILNCTGEKKEIIQCFEEIKRPGFKKIIKNAVSPYGDGTTSEKIIEILKKTDPESFKAKQFYDL